MLIYFDRQGAIKEIVSSYKLSDGTASFKKAEGNSSVNRIYCYFEGLAAALPSATAGAMSYKLPDGSTIGPRVSNALETLSIDFDASRDLRYFAYDKDYAFLRFDVPDEVFSLSGLISATASATIGDATYQFGPITFMVDGEVLAQADIDYSQWRYLISQFARYLPLSGGTMSGAIISEGTGRKATLGDGILKLEDTVYGRETEIGKYAIIADGGNFYYPSSSETGGTLITDKWPGFQNYLPISGGEITGEITTNNDEIYQKVIIGNGRIGVQDTDDGAFTYYDMGFIEDDNSKFYFPRGNENGGRFVTDKWSGFSGYLTKADAEQEYAKKADLGNYATKADLNGYATKSDLGNYATKKDLDDLKSIVYGIHSLTYNSYEFGYLTTSIIPDEVDGRKTVGGSYAIADWVGGNSFVYNQLVDKDEGSTETINGVTFTKNGDGSWLANGTATADVVKRIATIIIPKNHRYLMKGCASGGSFSTYYLRNDNRPQEARVDIGNGVIDTWDYTFNWALQVVIKSGTTLNNLVFRPQVFDLTLSNIDSVTTVEEAKAELLKRGVNVDEYNEFNDGEIKSTIVTKIESWGYNLLNRDTLELGWIVKGVDRNEGGYAIRTQGFIKVIGGKTYSAERFYSESNSNKIVQYDADYNFIKETASINSPYSITLEDNCRYVRLAFYFNTSVQSIPSTFNACFHLTGSRTGYAPYVGKLGQINIPNAPLKLDGVNDVHNLLIFEEQSDGSYNAIVTRNTDEYTFTGDEELRSYGTAGYYVAGTILTNAKRGSGLVSDYLADSSNDINPIANGTAICARIASNTIYFSTVTDGNRLSVAETLALIKGKKVVYPLATPTTETIATGLTFDKASFPIERGGSIEAIYEGVPPIASIDFMTKGE